MPENCDNCQGRNIGCKLIQDMNHDVQKMKRRKNIIVVFAWFTYALALLIGGMFVYRTFFPVVNPATHFNIMLTSASKEGKQELSPELQTKIKAELHEAFLSVEEKSARAYDEKFATLLTVLTIFGIAWPLIIGIIQFKFNEEEMGKIKNAIKTATEANENAQRTNNSLKDAKKQIYCEIAEATHHNAIFWETDMTDGATEKAKDNGKRCHVRALIKSIYYYALAGKIERANSKATTVLKHLMDMQNWPNEKQSFVINEIDWGLFLKLGIKRADEIKKLTDKIYCKPRPNEE